MAGIRHRTKRTTIFYGILLIAFCFCASKILQNYEQLVDFIGTKFSSSVQSPRTELGQNISENPLWQLEESLNEIIPYNPEYENPLWRHEEPLDEIVPHNPAVFRGEIKTYVVYNAFINDKRKNWDQIISAQLQNLNAIGLSENSTAIYVHLSTRHSNETDRIVANEVRHAVRLVKSVIPKAVVSVTTQNLFEYPGIRRVWDLGQQIPDHQSRESLILYFHSKGMFNGNHSEVRSGMEPVLFQYVIDPWRNITQAFQNDASINKAGFLKSNGGWMWYNFWWARASYVRNLVCPIVFDGSREIDRYYYESWLALVDEWRLWPRVESIFFPPNNRINHGRVSGNEDCLILYTGHKCDLDAKCED